MPVIRHHGLPRKVCTRVCAGLWAQGVVRARQSLVDPVTVDRLTAGTRTVSTTAERLQATAVLAGRGVSLLATADLIGVTDRTISRYRIQLRNQRRAA